ncbi:MAG: TonB-dependent receptor [Chitinophagaceae bacterium]|nr:TonB-dependent receptor [Chitinophagaceae bacterium]
MTKTRLLIFFLLISIYSIAQTKTSASKKTDNFKPVKDTLDILRDNVANNISTISIDENDLGDGVSQNVSSILTAGRDPFLIAAAYNFSALRFRMRGYESDLSAVYINGISMDNLDNGFTPFGVWGGLNDVMRNRDVSIGLRPNTYAFGDIATTTFFDTRASKQRKQSEVGYVFSNRNFQHRIDFTHNTGISKKGWAFSLSGTRRYAAEGYFAGTTYDGWSWFAAADKRIGQNHLLSLVAFGAPTTTGRQGTAVKEAFDLVGTTNYNPFWGWQNGKKRNANNVRTDQPFLILTHDFRINNNSSLVTAVNYSSGDRASSNLDWYRADNPNPLYYRYLPSYWEDPNLKAQLTKEWQTNDDVRQINWNRLYDANRAQQETFNGVTGKRSRYVQFEYVTNATKMNANTVYNTRIGDHVEITSGATYQYQKNHNYKKIIDLLGGDYYVDLNQFAERINANNPDLPQSNLLNPNRIVRVGDDYSYNYDITIKRASGWAQMLLKYNKLDFYAAIEMSNTSFFRNGNYKNGLFPTNSLGKSATQNFNNYAFKTGMTYKLNGRNYLFANVAMLTRAPFFDNVYLSPRLRHTTQDVVSSEEVNSLEAGYTLNAPKIKIRLTGYYTEFKNQMNVMTFFHDTYLNLVNYGITGINKTHAGGEFGIEARPIANVVVNAAAAVGRFYYTSSQNATTTIDNDASVVSRDVVFAKDYYVGGTPQEAYSFGITYRSPKFWNVGLTYNFFDAMYVEINPLRRTAAAVQGLTPGSDQWKKILDQQKLPAQSTLDLYASYSWKLPRKLSVNKNSNFLFFSLSATNLLNNTSIIPFAFEQLRFDNITEYDKFPRRYNYNFGVNYAATISLRF